jgi:hypothetical protein
MKDRRFMVSLAKPDHDMKGVKVDNKEYRFSKSGHSFYVKDHAVAKDIDQAMGQKATKDVVVSEVPMANVDGIHNYTFSVQKPELEDVEREDLFEWVEVSPGIHKLVKRDGVHIG